LKAEQNFPAKSREETGGGDQNLGDTRNTLVRQFHAPETPGRKCRLLCRHCHSKISSPNKVLKLPSSQEHSSLHRKKLSTSLPYSSKNHNLKKKDSTAKISHATARFCTSRKQKEREREREKERNRSKADKLELQATEMNTNCRSGRKIYASARGDKEKNPERKKEPKKGTQERERGEKQASKIATRRTPRGSSTRGKTTTDGERNQPFPYRRNCFAKIQSQKSKCGNETDFRDFNCQNSKINNNNNSCQISVHCPSR
jgi:hypothetical protein